MQEQILPTWQKSIDLKLAPGIMIKLSEMKHYYVDRTYARFRAE